MSTTRIHLTDEEKVNKPKWDLPPTIDYDLIATQLCRPDGQLPDKNSFEIAVREANGQLLLYLIRNLYTTGTLDYEEEQALLWFYFEDLHAELIEELYPHFARFFQEHLRLQEQPYFNNNCYLATSAFIQLTSATMNSLADAALAFGKGHPEFAATVGFEVMGKIGELITERFLPAFHDHLFKNALYYQYNYFLEPMHQAVVEILRPLVVDTRKMTKTVIARWSAGDLMLKGVIALKAIVNLGLRVDQITLHVDHQREVIYVQVPKEPLFMELVHYDHKLKGYLGTFRKDCPFLNINPFKPRHFTLSGRLTNGHLNSTFLKYMPPDPTQLRINRAPLGRRAMKAFVPLLRESLKPMVANLPHSGYRVKLRYGNRLLLLVRGK